MAILTAIFMMIPVIRFVERRNGGPFKVGDSVRILIGPHKDKICKVYSTWQHNEVRVKLDSAAEKDFSDIFSGDKLFKEDK